MSKTAPLFPRFPDFVVEKRVIMFAMTKIVAAKVLDGYRAWLRFEDGTEGEVDLSAHAGKGVFAPWSDYTFFRRVAIGGKGRILTWPGELDFCSDALWLQVTGKQSEDLFANLRKRHPVHTHT